MALNNRLIGWVFLALAAPCGHAQSEVYKCPDASGRPTRLAGVSIDITDRKRGEERQKLLLDELNHRVKNTLATVQSIALQTRRTASSPEDFSRALDHALDVHTTPITQLMTRGGKVARADMLAAEALQLMQKHKISALPVVDAGQQVIGAFNLQDLLRAGVV